MVSVQSWFAVADRLMPLTYAGPLVSPTTANAAVVRLKQAAAWARPRLGELSGLPNAAATAQQSRILVVDRHGLVRALRSKMVSGEPDLQLPVHAGFEAVRMVRYFARHLQGFWYAPDAGTGISPRMLLVAPNVWNIAVDNRFDQGDYAKWVALRTGLWGTFFTQGPWLNDYLRFLTIKDGKTGDEPDQLARVAVLLSQVVSGQLEKITPQEIPSINWIRQRVPRSSMVEVVHKLHRLDLALPDMVGLEALGHDFVRSTKLADCPAALATFLAGPENVPSREEMTQPKLWLERVGLD